jgi:NADH dehydrogenase [ubiquinone] 1 alpha subcomplex assembly factor 6
LTDELVSTGDYEAYLNRRFIPPAGRDAYDACRALNLELARLPEVVSTPTIGQMRMQFWKDAVEKVFAGKPPQQPIATLLYAALTGLAQREPQAGASSLKFWLLRLIQTREKYMDLRPFASLSALEDYAENTYASLMYLTLASLPLRSTAADHIASHIGKAAGMVAILRGVPLLGAPPRSVHPSAAALPTRRPVLLLPLDVMADAGVREEDVFRIGAGAPGLQDAIFKVATSANDHLLTARDLLHDLQSGREPSHRFEHENEPQHAQDEDQYNQQQTSIAGIRDWFGILLEAIPAQDYLDRLQAVNFDVFALYGRSWRLPWRIWSALRHQRI